MFVHQKYILRVINNGGLVCQLPFDNLLCDLLFTIGNREDIRACGQGAEIDDFLVLLPILLM